MQKQGYKKPPKVRHVPRETQRPTSISAPSKRHRELRALIEGTGLQLLLFYCTGSDHIGALCQAPDGTQRKFTCARTPSDHRSDKNQRSMLRFFAREHALPLH